MRLRTLGAGFTIGAALLATAAVVGPTANATTAIPLSGRPCGPTHSTAGSGSQGTGWTLKSKYDDDGAKPGVVVGEEFQINTEQAGQVWSIQLADNGLVFLNKTFTSTAAGITAMSNTPDQNRTDQVMTATARNLGNGETITNASLTVPGPPPAACGQGNG